MTNPPRIKVLDLLRGFALGGILLINAMSILAVKGSTPAFTIDIPWKDRFLQDLILFFVESKFFTLFSLLFGISFAIQIESAARQGKAFLPRILRRLIALLLFGILHITLLWDGDILVIYSIAGALLILFYTINTRFLRRWIIALLAIPATLIAGILTTTLLLRFSQSAGQALRKSDQSIAQSFADTTATQRLLDASFLAGVHDRWMTYVDLLPLLLSRIPVVLAMFLLGLWIGRSGFLHTFEERSELLAKVRNLTLLLGFALMFIIVLATKFLPTTSALVAIIEDQYLVGPILCLGYASALVLAYLKNPQRKIFDAFSYLGRMALSNYLLQSLILAALSYGWGFGLALKLSGFQVLGISACLFVVQVIFSRFWLRHFSYGPFEWAWRSATYWNLMPIASKSKALNSVYE